MYLNIFCYPLMNSTPTDINYLIFFINDLTLFYLERKKRKKEKCFRGRIIFLIFFSCQSILEHLHKVPFLFRCSSPFLNRFLFLFCPSSSTTIT